MKLAKFSRLLRVTLLKMKIALLSLSLSSSTFITITLPSTWTAVRVYLSPPYIFFAVNCIVIVIWILSKQSNYKLQHDSDDKHPSKGGLQVGTTGKTKKLPDDRTRVFSQSHFQYSIPPSSGNESESSCIAATILDGGIVVDSRRKSRGPSTGYFNPTPTSGREDELIDGFDATWKSIMEKKKSDATWRVLPEVEELKSSLTITRNPISFSNHTRREPPELKTDEEIDAFIKKTKDQIRLKKKLRLQLQREMSRTNVDKLTWSTMEELEEEDDAVNCN